MNQGWHAHFYDFNQWTHDEQALDFFEIMKTAATERAAIHIQTFTTTQAVIYKHSQQHKQSKKKREQRHDYDSTLMTSSSVSVKYYAGSSCTQQTYTQTHSAKYPDDVNKHTRHTITATRIIWYLDDVIVRVGQVLCGQLLNRQQRVHLIVDHRQFVFHVHGQRHSTAQQLHKKKFALGFKEQIIMMGFIGFSLIGCDVALTTDSF